MQLYLIYFSYPRDYVVNLSINLFYKKKYFLATPSVAMEPKESYVRRLGKHLKNIRESKGISLRELALCIDSDKPTISKVENGRLNPTIYFLKRICEGLEITERELFEEFE